MQHLLCLIWCGVLETKMNEPRPALQELMVS